MHGKVVNRKPIATPDSDPAKVTKAHPTVANPSEKFAAEKLEESPENNVIVWETVIKVAMKVLADKLWHNEPRESNHQVLIWIKLWNLDVRKIWVQSWN